MTSVKSRHQISVFYFFFVPISHHSFICLSSKVIRFRPDLYYVGIATEINNNILRNLNDSQLKALAAYINEKLWKPNRLAMQWKHSTITTIPKPGKTPGIENLRPISLTSRVRKVYERIITTRLQKHFEENMFPDDIICFRSPPKMPSCSSDTTSSITMTTTI